jgi:hypothetical protein
VRKYLNYSDIPEIIKEYILTVSRRKSLEELSISEINDYLLFLEESYSIKDENFEEVRHFDTL